MKNLTKSLLLAGAFFALGLQESYASDTNKTFLATRPVLINLAVERPTWHTQINKKLTKDDHMFGASMQAVGFFEQSTNDDDLGRYFGFSDKRNLVVGTGGATGIDIDRSNLIHKVPPFATTGSFTGDAIGLKGTLNLQFEHQAAGVRFDYQQDLHCLLKGLFFKVSSAVVWEKTEAELGLSASQTQTVDPASGSTGVIVSIADYFAGNITQPAGSNQQAALQYAKINGSHSKTELADIDVILGWNFYCTHKHHAGLNIGATFPTGSKPKMHELFEPVGGGNRGHWGIGAGFDGKATAWQKEDQKVELAGIVNWRYLFKGDEKRTLNIAGIPWSQYMLVGTNGQKGVQPLANVSTLTVDVTPGNYIDAAVILSYLNGGFTFDIGYNPFWKDEDHISYDDSFPSSTYAIAGSDYDATTNFDSTKIAGGSPTISQLTTIATTPTNTTFLTQSSLDKDVAQSPSQLTHKLFAGLGYAFNEWDTPFMLGVSGYYEFAPEQKALQQWGVQGRLGISF